MELTVNGHKTFCYTGGRPFDASQPTVLFIHGALNDHSVWGLQSRYFAHHGWNVLALELPGHWRSAGPPPQTVQEAAGFVLALLDAAGLQRAALVGQSFGSLIALEVAASAPARVSQLVLTGIAYPMKVSPTLLETSLSDPLKAIEMVNVYSHSTLAPPPSALGPGTWVPGMSRALMRRMLASNRAVNVFHRGFKACDDYRGGDEQMAKVQCPTLFILGRSDQMTPPAGARSLIARAAQGKVVHVPAGHQMMTEAPEAVLSAMKEFLQP